MDQPWWNPFVWVSLALVASLISWRIGVSVALVELVLGVVAGNTLHPPIGDWMNFLASTGALVLTFLAGAELDRGTVKRFWKQSLLLGLIGFAAPFALVWGLTEGLLGWERASAQIAGLALSTTSVAVVYAVMVETGLNETPLGKLILAACFVNDLGTVAVLGFLFTTFDIWFWVFVGITLLAMLVLPRAASHFLARFRSHPSEPGIRYLLPVLFGLALIAVKGGSEGVLPAYLAGMVLADTFSSDRELLRRMRAMAFALLTPFYFLRAGSFVSLPAVMANVGLVVLFSLGKTVAKFIGLFPVGMAMGMPKRANLYNTLMMSTGLTFGTISALYGLTHGLITEGQYSVLVVVVILTALIPTVVAQAFVQPRERERGCVLREGKRETAA
ncbi:MAG: cation:proton antiporter [Anaerolineae bacterium]|jgi:Kef-type K+ transport system membrane component KefB|nr:cation:proton antiporter [Anaerolineae bacterium]